MHTSLFFQQNLICLTIEPCKFEKYKLYIHSYLFASSAMNVSKCESSFVDISNLFYLRRVSCRDGAEVRSRGPECSTFHRNRRGRILWLEDKILASCRCNLRHLKEKKTFTKLFLRKKNLIRMDELALLKEYQKRFLFSFVNKIKNAKYFNISL